MSAPTYDRRLHIWVPTNRRAHLKGKARGTYQSVPTHMDGWNELKAALEKGRNFGARVFRTNVRHVAKWARLAMRDAGWPAMDEQSAVPCVVDLTFVERDRRRDVGNVHGGAKYALDALTARHKYGAGAIYDDSQRWLPEVRYHIAYVGERYREPGLAITITPMEAGDEEAICQDT